MTKKINLYDVSCNDMYKLLMESDEFALYVVNALLQPVIKYTSLTRPNPTLYEAGSKDIEIDSLLYLDINTPVIIEMQRYKRNWLLTRLGVYEGRIASITIESGKNSYENYVKPILIVFTTFNVFNDDYYVHKVSDRQVKTTNFKGKKPKKKVTEPKNYFNNSSIADTYIVEVKKIPDQYDGNDLWIKKQSFFWKNFQFFRFVSFSK